MSLRLPDPGSFEDLLGPTRIEVASLVRLSRHPATEPYWSAGVYRFDDPDPGGADAFGTCCPASTIEVAFAESVVHECGRFVGDRYEVPAAELTERSFVRFACERRKTLVLADLTGAALKSLGLNNDISASADYTTSQAWARAFHGASLRWDGIRYLSRLMHKGSAYPIFERGGLRKLRSEKLKARQVDALCDRFNVTAVRRRRGPNPKVGKLVYTGRSSAKTGRLRPASCGLSSVSRSPGIADQVRLIVVAGV